MMKCETSTEWDEGANRYQISAGKYDSTYGKSVNEPTQKLQSEVVIKESWIINDIATLRYSDYQEIDAQVWLKIPKKHLGSSDSTTRAQLRDEFRLLRLLDERRLERWCRRYERKMNNECQICQLTHPQIQKLQLVRESAYEPKAASVSPQETNDEIHEF